MLVDNWFLAILFFCIVIPWGYLYLRRKEYKKDKEGLILKVIIYPITGAVLSYIFSYFIFGALASVVSYTLYGNAKDMFVDTLLQFFGNNPIAYQRVEDKWIALHVQLFIRSFILFPTIFGALPLFFLYHDRKQYKKNRKELITHIIFFPILGAAFGCLVLYYILGALASAAAYSLYGGTI